MVITNLIVLFIVIFMVNMIVVYGLIWCVHRWQEPAQNWLKVSTEQSLADFLVYMPARVFWARFAFVLTPILGAAGVFISVQIAMLVAVCLLICVVVGKNFMLTRRHQIITRQLPDALDMLVTATSAGLSFHAALERTASQLPIPLRFEWQLISRLTRTGEGTTSALQNFYHRVPTEGVLQMLLTVQLGLQHGAQQAQVLQRLALSLRQQHYAIERVRSLSAQARMQGKVMMLLPAGLFIILHFLHPENTRVLLATSAGNYLLFSCLVLMVLGNYLIRKVLGTAYAQ